MWRVLVIAEKTLSSLHSSRPPLPASEDRDVAGAELARSRLIVFVAQDHRGCSDRGGGVVPCSQRGVVGAVLIRGVGERVAKVVVSLAFALLLEGLQRRHGAAEMNRPLRRSAVRRHSADWVVVSLVPSDSMLSQPSAYG